MKKKVEVYDMKALVVFFSRADENYFGGQLKYIEVGNTEIAAKQVSELLDADLLKLEMKTPYSAQYKECVQEAKKHYEENARPELVGLPETIEEYDTIILGYPNYCGTIPMPVATFLEAYDFKGKKILPFCTNEGSGMGRSEMDIRKICPSAKVENGLSIRGSQAAQAGESIQKWLK